MADSQQYEESLESLKELRDRYGGTPGGINEAETRFRIIDELLLSVLCWERDDFDVERHHIRQYTDYEFKYPRRLLILEAKRQGNSFDLPIGVSGLKHRLRSLRRDNPELDEAIDQVSSYCRERGVPLAGVSNGHQLVLFVAARTDGIPPDDGDAVVFPSWDAMIDNFRHLWNFLSKSAIGDQELYRFLVSGDAGAVPPKLSAAILNYPEIKGRNSLQTDLRILSELVFEGAPRDPALEAQFLTECYCQSGALSQYSLASKAIMKARYASLFDSRQDRPTVLPATTKKGVRPDLISDGRLSRKPILLIGDVGVGKTTFIRQLILLDNENLFDKAIAFYIDLGSGATFSSVSDFVLREIINQMIASYDLNPFDDNIVRGVYDLELKQFSNGIFGPLRKSDPEAYQKEEISFLKEKIAKTDQHILAVATHLVKARKKQLVIFVDNADQRDDEVQQEAFLVAQELSERWPATVFVTLRPETFHASTKRGALSGYHPKAFTIDPPRIDHAVKARIKFAKKLTRGEFELESLEGVGLHLDALHALLEVFERSLVRNVEIITCIESISRANVRMALQIVSEFFGSGHVDTDKILAKQSAGGYTIPLHELLRAIIYGDYAQFDPERSPIVNIFDVGHNDPREHFAMPFALWLLHRPGSVASESGFVESGAVFEMLQSEGFLPDQVDRVIFRCLKFGLIETAGRRIRSDELSMAAEYRLTALGAYHVARLVNMFTYIDAVVIDTPILDRDVRSTLRPDCEAIRDRLNRAETFVKYLSSVWSDARFSNRGFGWSSAAGSIHEEIERIQASLDRRTFRY